MVTIIDNEFNLKQEDIYDTVKRVKALIINSNKEVLLGYSYHEYQFPGGHVEENENYIDALIREVQEEVGIKLKNETILPLVSIHRYCKDWIEIGKNRKIEIYYYIINIDTKPNLKNTRYTTEEKEGNFELRYIPLSIVEEEIKNNARVYGDPKGISNEMLKVIEFYKNNYK